MEQEAKYFINITSLFYYLLVKLQNKIKERLIEPFE